MKTLHFDYWMEISYTEPVTECHYTFKCLPKDTDMQQISELKVEIMPHHDYQRGEDSWGNVMIYDDLYQKHDRFGFHIQGTAKTGLTVGEKENSGELVGPYIYPYGLNKAGDRIKAYYKKVIETMGESCASAYETAMYFMNCLYRDFTYEKWITDVNTTAEEAWHLKRGVCQDYAHIFIAMCHLAKIPARYVTGMMTGEGYSHAWAEILSEGIWYGVDPTNGCTVGDSYIKIGMGRDANDCKINKGIMTGGGLQTQSICVRVEEKPE